MRFLVIALALSFLGGFAGTLVAKEERCLPVPKDMVEALDEGFDMAVRGKWRLRNAQAVRSKTYKKLFFISAEIDGPGVKGKGDIGTWASNSLQVGHGIIMSVSPMAKEFSVWPDGKRTKANITMFDDGAMTSKNCVSSLNKRR